MNNPHIQPNRTELLKIFDVTPQWVNLQKRKHTLNQINTAETNLLKWQTLLNKTEPHEEWFVNDRIDVAIYYLTKLNNTLHFLRQQLKDIKEQVKDPTVKPKANPTYDIEAIKQIPIRSILERHGIQITAYKKFKLRNEKTPSCWLYEDQNRYWDFGASQGGDNINLYQELNNCDFQQALKELSYYI